MRVITGTARGCRLETLEGMDTRPTAERVKEGLFSVIQFDIEGRRVLDLFAGSGQLGVEAMSRGAASCVFVDKNPSAVEVIRRNLKAAGLTANTQVVCVEAGAYLTRPGETFDLAFLDPPYAADLLEPTLQRLTAHMSAGGIIVCETDTDAAQPEQVENFTLARTYRYGRTWVWLYRSCGAD